MGKNLRGIGGWLLIFVIIQFSILLNSAIIFIPSFFKVFFNQFLFALVLYIILFLVTLISLIVEFKKKDYAPRWAIANIVYYGLFQINLAMQPLLLKSFNWIYFLTFIANLFFIVAGAMIFITYFLKSERVKNTYLCSITNPKRNVRSVKTGIISLISLGLIVAIITAIWFFSMPYPLEIPNSYNKTDYILPAHYSDIYTAKFIKKPVYVQYSYKSDYPISLFIVINTTKGSVRSDELFSNPQKFTYPGCFSINKTQSSIQCMPEKEFRVIIVNNNEFNASVSLEREVIYNQIKTNSQNNGIITI